MKLKSYNPFYYKIYGSAREVSVKLPPRLVKSRKSRPSLIIRLPDGSERRFGQRELELADYRIKSASEQERRHLRESGLDLPEAPKDK